MSPSDKKAADDAKKPDAAKKPAKKSAAKPAATKKAAASASVPDSQAAERKKGGFTGTLIVLLVAAAFVGGFVAWPQLSPRFAPYLPADWQPGADRVAEIAGALDSLAARIADVEKSASEEDPGLDRLRGDISAIAGRVAKLEAAPDTPPDLDDRLAALETEISGLSQKTNEIAGNVADHGVDHSAGASGEPSAALLKRLTALEAALAGALQDQGQTEALREQNAALAARLSTAEARLAALADQQDTAGDGSGEGAALVAAVSQLRVTVEGGRDFAADLAAVEQLAGDAGSGVLAEVARLKATGVQGLATLAELRRDLAALAPALVRSAGPENEGWMGRAWSRVASLVSIRRTGEVEGVGAEARVARAEARLKAGELDAAIKEISKLEGNALDTAASWLQRARARQDAIDAVAALSRLAVARLAGRKAEAR